MVFDRANLPYWILLGAGVSLFLFVINAGGGDDDLDADIDGGIDSGIGDGIDVDVDADTDVLSLNWLGWLGIGKAPLILLLATDLSLWGAIGWMLNVAGSPFVLLISFAASLISGSWIARPLGKVFASFGENARSDRLLGCVGTVSSAAIFPAHRNKIGQIDVIDSAKTLVTINAVLPNWATTIPKYGQSVLIIEHDAWHYVVIASNSTDYDRWFEQSAVKKHR